MGYIIRNKKYAISLDLYLLDSYKNDRGDFKRLIPPPVKPQDLELDCLIATYDTGNHFNVGPIPLLVSKNVYFLIIDEDDDAS